VACPQWPIIGGSDPIGWEARQVFLSGRLYRLHDLDNLASRRLIKVSDVDVLAGSLSAAHLLMPPAATDDSDAASSPGMPSEGVRTIVSLLLFIHLFALLLAVMTSSDSGSAEFLRDIKERSRFLDSYLTQLWMDRGYDYYLMNDQNWDFRLEATVRYPDGHADEPIVLPEPSLSPERRQRYQQLGWVVAQSIARAGNPDAREIDVARKSLLPQSIGGALFQQHPDAESVALKCIYHRGISPEDMRSENPKDKDPFNPQYFTTSSDMSIVMDHGTPTVFENLTPPEVSPVHRSTSAKSSAAPAPPSSSKGPADGGK
jgi:hypothetical protein